MTVLLILFIIGFIIGTYQYFTERNQIESCNIDLEHWNDEPNEVPFYIDEQIQAIYNQISAYHNMIDIYRETANYTNDINKKAMYNKRIADLEYKCSKLEEKVYKLLEKWEC